MPQITIPVALPDINLGQIVPIVALVILGALILVTLTARSLIKSRAFTIAAIALIFVAGSSTLIVGGLQAVALVIGVAGVAIVAVVIALNRSPEVIDVVRLVVDSTIVMHAQDQPARSQLLNAPPPIGQLPAAGQTSAPQTAAPRRRSSIVTLPKDWGF